MKKIKLTESELIELIKKLTPNNLIEGIDDMEDLNFSDYDDSDDYDDDMDDKEEDSLEKYKREFEKKIETDEDFDESDVDEIFSFKGPTRRFRASIYVDGLVPDTDNKEFDRQVAQKVMEFYAKQLGIENYVGGAGFKTGNLLNPYDKEF
jgi:hypothetical protein